MKNFIPAIEDIIQAVELSGEEEKEGQQEIRSQKVEVRDDKAESCSVQEEAQFQLALIYNDFAIQCFCKGLYAEATLLLNKAIEEEKGQAGLYVNRGGEAVTPDLSVCESSALFTHAMKPQMFLDRAPPKILNIFFDSPQPLIRSLMEM